MVMMRALWSVPSAVIAWFVVGFAPSYLGGLPAGATAFVPSDLSRGDILVLGGFAGGVAAGLLVRWLRIAVPLVSVLAGTAWWLSGQSIEAGDSRDLLISLLAASVLGATAGAVGTHGSVFAALALALPVAWYVARPAAELAGWRWSWQVNGLLVATGLAVLLYLACWRRGWPSAYYWVLVAAAYLASFGVVTAADRVARDLGSGRSPSLAADDGTDAFFSTFEPFLRAYWPWLVAAVLLAIPMVALKIRALPPPPPPPDRHDDRGNDAHLSDDLDWIDRLEPKRRLLPRREPATPR
ncbi:MAG TPA: hypothetical protein VFT31_04815 [Kribbella sp.]|nr:hypothetical protein [Kribbella sp.]